MLSIDSVTCLLWVCLIFVGHTLIFLAPVTYLCPCLLSAFFLYSFKTCCFPKSFAIRCFNICKYFKSLKKMKSKHMDNWAWKCLKYKTCLRSRDLGLENIHGEEFIKKYICISKICALKSPFSIFLFSFLESHILLSTMILPLGHLLFCIKPQNFSYTPMNSMQVIFC